MEKAKPSLTEQPFWVADWYVDPRAGRISRQGAEAKLEPKVMTVLVLLASQPGEVLSRETLEDNAWPGVVVGYDALSTTIIKLRKALGDNSRHPRYIETVSKKGYRLIAAVSQDGKPAMSSVTADQPGRALPRIRRTTAMYTGIAVLAVVALLVTLMQVENPGTPSDAVVSSIEPSLVVLPFTNRNNDRQQDYFSDGITGDLINDLSRYSGLRVIASRSAFIYKQRKADIQTIAHELGVNYVLDGSVWREHDNLRVNVELVNADTGVNIWAQRFERQTSDIFDVQDDIREKILESLAVTLTTEERKRVQRRYTNNFAAYDLFLQGQASLITRASANDSRRAEQLMEQAIKLDPDFARAHAALALIHADAYRFDWADDPPQTRQLALTIGKRAVELDERSPQANWILGYIYLFLYEDHANAIKYAERATELAPGDPDGLTLLAVTHAFGDDPARAKLIIEQLMQHNANYSALVPSVLGLANFRLGHYEESLDAYDKSLLINPSRIQGNAYKAVVLFRMGNIDDAEWQVDQLYSLHPDFEIDIWAARQPFRDKSIVQGMVADLKKMSGE